MNDQSLFNVVNMGYDRFIDETIDGFWVNVVSAKTCNNESIFHPMSIYEESERELIQAIKDAITFDPRVTKNQKIWINFMNKKSLNFSFIVLH